MDPARYVESYLWNIMSEQIDNPDSREGDYSGLQMEKTQQQQKSDFIAAMFSAWHAFSDFDFRITSSEKAGQKSFRFLPPSVLSMLLC